MSQSDGFANQVGSRNRTSPRNGTLDTEVAPPAVGLLRDAGINDRATFVRCYDADDSEEVRAVWISSSDQCGGISWRYFLILNRIEPVRPGRMIQRPTARAAGRDVTPDEVGALATGASAILDTDLQHPDHRTWRFEHS